MRTWGKIASNMETWGKREKNKGVSGVKSPLYPGSSACKL